MAYMREPDIENPNFGKEFVGEELERLITTHEDEEVVSPSDKRKPYWFVWEAGFLIVILAVGTLVLQYRHLGYFFFFQPHVSAVVPPSLQHNRFSPVQPSNITKSLTPPVLPQYPAPVLPRRANVFRVDAYGAIGDGVTVNTAAFCNVMVAAAAMAERGGATVFVPAGRWLTGPFSMASNTTLLVGKQATILASTRLQDYSFMPEMPSYCPPTATPMFQPFISGLNLSGIVITGQGTIDGQGAPWWAARRANISSPRPPRLLEFVSCQDIIVSGLKLKDPAHWAIHPIYSSDVHIHGLTIVAPKDSKNTDGVDPDSCENVMIENCSISTGDDSVAIKSGRDNLGLAFARPTRNITLRSLTIGPFTHGISLGSEVSGGISDVDVYDINVLGGDQALRIKTMAGRGSYVSRVRFHNVWARSVRRGLQITSMYSSHYDAHPCGGTYNNSLLTNVSDISLSGFVCSHCQLGVQIHGFAKSPFRVNVSDVVLVDNVQPWECSNVIGRATKATPQPCAELRLR